MSKIPTARRRIKAAEPEEEVEVLDTTTPAEEVAPAVSRPAMRPRATDAREPQHEQLHAEPRRTRRRKSTAQEDMFYIPVDQIPEGSSYEWKRWSVNGLEDPFYIAQLREQGWEPVNPKRHPTWVPPGYSQPHIIKGGQILMERPMELTEEARLESRQLARQQVRVAEQRLGKTPEGELARVAPKLTKEIGRMVPQVIQDE
jgi:hypothetical protein